MDVIKFSSYFWLFDIYYFYSEIEDNVWNKSFNLTFMCLKITCSTCNTLTVCILRKVRREKVFLIFCHDQMLL